MRSSFGLKVSCLAALAATALSGPRPAAAAFYSINGLQRDQLLRSKVAVGLVSVKDLAVTWRTSYARSGHLELVLVDHLFGTPPSPASLRRVPYTAGVGYNSAWPDLGPDPRGSYLVMAWRNGYPCGEGSAVHFGERFSLPMAVDGPSDPRVVAIRDTLKLIAIPDEGLRLRRLEQAFVDSPNPYSVLFADGGLMALDPQHRHSAGRYARLLSVITATPGADEELGWPLLQELSRFPPIRDAEAYQDWNRNSQGPSADGSWPSFRKFRRQIQTRFRNFADNLKAQVDLRRWALTALAAPPCFVASRGDELDARAMLEVGERLRDALPEVRREAARSLLAMAAALRSSDRATARRLLAQVRQSLRREIDPEERVNLQIRIDAIAGGK